MLSVILFTTQFQLTLLLIPAAVDSIQKIKINGIGSSFPEAAFRDWSVMFKTKRYKHDHDVVIDYRARGSGAGECTINGQCKHENVSYVFAGSDLLQSNKYYQKNRHLKRFPIIAGALAVIYNIPAVKLKISIDDLTEIYGGKIRFWNDSRLQSRNGFVLPNEPIYAVARKEAEGTTEVLTTAFSHVSCEWNTKYGVFSGSKNNGSTHFPKNAVFLYSNRAIGVIGIVASVRYSIGYAPLGAAKRHGLQVASLYNYRANLVQPPNILKGVKDSMAYVENQLVSDLPFSLIDEPSFDAYPLAMYSFMIVNTSTSPGVSCEQMKEFVRYMEWCFASEEARKAAERNEIITVGPKVAEIIRFQVLKRITCKGKNIYDLMITEWNEETAEDRRPMVILVGTACSSFAIILLVSFAVICYNRFEMRKRFEAKTWQLRQGDITPLSGQESNVSLESSATLCAVDGDNKQWISLAKHVKLGPVIMFQCIDETHRISAYTVHSSRLVHKFLDEVSHRNVMLLKGLVEFGSGPVKFVYNCEAYRCTLHGIIKRRKYNISEDVKLVLAIEVARGMQFLHESGVIHGSLNSTTCFLDFKWTVRIADWAHSSVVEQENGKGAWSRLLRAELLKAYAEGQNVDTCTRMLNHYTDPVLFKETFETISYKKWHDVHSFGMLVAELSQESEPFSGLDRSTILEILHLLAMKPSADPYIPINIAKSIKPIVERCLNRNSMLRPNFLQLQKQLMALSTKANEGIVGVLLNSMEEYMNQLEEKVEERTADLRSVTTKLETLLHDMLPKEIAEKLKDGLMVEPEYYAEASIYFSYIVDFTKISSSSTPLQIVTLLNSIYSRCDDIIDGFDVYKVETIGKKLDGLKDPFDSLWSFKTTPNFSQKEL